MTTAGWLPALLGYLIPVGLFLVAWGGMEPRRARKAATLGALSLSLAALGYFAVGFAFHLGGAGWMSDHSGLQTLRSLYGGGGELGWGIVGLTGFFLSGEAATEEMLALFVIYLPLVAAAVLLVMLSASAQARGWQAAVGGLVMAMVLFPLVACWAWGGGWLANLGSTIQRGHGSVDHAGSGVVYLLGGAAALGALVGLRGRLPRGDIGKPDEMPSAHFPLLANLGALLFGLGCLGWSLSEPFHAAGAELGMLRIGVNGALAGAAAILVSQLYCWFTVGHAEPLMSARGMVAGFVAIAAGAPLVPMWSALVIGAVAGLLLPLGVYFVEKVLRLPDATATVPLGITSGLWGTLAVALFSDGRWGRGWNGIGLHEYRTVLGQGVTGFFPPADVGFSADGPGQMLAQAAGIAAIAAAGFLVSWVVFAVLNAPYRAKTSSGTDLADAEAAAEMTTQLEVPPAAERDGSGSASASDEERVCDGIESVADQPESLPQPDNGTAEIGELEVDREKVVETALGAQEAESDSEFAGSLEGLVRADEWAAAESESETAQETGEGSPEDGTATSRVAGSGGRLRDALDRWTEWLHR